jgi:hypothetical protein
MVLRLLALASIVAVVPAPLRGTTLPPTTGLRLLVASNPPFFLDVDTRRIVRLSGLNVRGKPVLSVLAVGREAVIWLDRRPATSTLPAAEIYVVRHGTARATRLATAWEVAPAADGRAVWLKSYRRARRCDLREVTLAGRERTPRRAVPCSSRLIDAGTGALLVRGRDVLDPRTGRTLLRTSGILASSDKFVLSSAGPRRPLTVWDLRSGQSWTLGWPSEIGGSDEAAVDRRDGLIAVAFSDPAYGGGGTQVTDVWLLDPAVRRFEQLPDMPAAVSLKRTSMRWATDGRLVILGETAGRHVVAVWKPSQERIAVGRVRLPARTSGSDSFVVWRG